ncbi:MAG TPA: alanine racemase [Alphaproteobacteria bacterium]|nr:alanine racemase [Alphaproteobacteria bacterium]
MSDLAELPTPTALLDRAKLDRNLARMATRMRTLGADLKPHMKTAKSAEIARHATQGFSGGLTVSTLAEAAYFAEAGFPDITYAVGIVPSKLPAAAALIERGVALTLLTDSPAAARAVGAEGRRRGIRFSLLIEIDTGSGRAGVVPGSDLLLEVARAVVDGGSDLAGVLTHAGNSYQAKGAAALRAVAEEERAGVVTAAERLRKAGFPCPRVSAGSTPTAAFAEHLTGVTDMRPGIYMFGDLMQTAIGTCNADDIALTILASVVGIYPERNLALIDAGSLALSADRGAAGMLPDTGNGWVLDIEGHRIEGLFVDHVHQEHGFVTARSALPFERLVIGTRLRILPNHSCITAAAYDRYHVVEGGHVVAEWERVNGW